MLNYYEELGLTSSASREDIQQAFKQVARLLHPDRFPDANVRRTMEAQMKRLNLVQMTLTDARGRAAYDRSLQLIVREPVVALIPRGARSWMTPQVWVWLAAGLLAGSLLYVAFRDGVGPAALPTVAAAQAGRPDTPIAQPVARVVSREEASREVASRDAASKEDEQAHRLQSIITQLQQRVNQMERERLAASLADIRPLLADPVRAIDSPAALAPMGSPEMSEPARVAMAGVPEPGGTAAPSKSRLTGTWFYAPRPRRTLSKEMYAPEYIEAVIVEQAGQLRGRYRARYRVTDRAISPDVLFQFEGEPAREEVAANWMGEGGARGEVRLKLLSENQLEVAWIANELGHRQGLGSGRAILVRRQTP